MSFRIRPCRLPLALILMLLLAIEPALWGCSSTTDPPPPEDPIETASSEGTVDESAIGGEDLEVVSVWDEAQAVDDNGEFDIVVSTEGTQLLMVQDESENVRGLALSMPDGQRGVFEELRFDATSTLLSLLMMTPGILTVDPTEASARREELQDLPEYEIALTLFEDQLPERTLHDLLELDSVNDALEACVIAWASRHRDRIHPPRFPERDSGFNVSIQDDSDPASTQVQLANAAWRFINVHRRDLDAQGHELGVVEIADGIDSMNGAEPIGWGSVFTWNLGNPTIGADEVDFDPSSEVAQAEYWAIGMGWGPESLNLPSSMDGGYVDAVALTIAWYMVFPLIDLFLGAAHLLELGGEGLTLAWSVISGLDTANISEASSSAEIITATIDVAFACISMLAVAGAAGGLMGISAPVWVVIGVVIAAFGAGFALANAVLAVDSWIEVPNVTMDVVYNGSTIDIVVTTPSSSTIWHHGQTDCIVEWIPSAASTIHADLFRDGEAIDIFHDWTENDGHLVRMEPIPESWGTSANFQIRMWDEDSNSGMSVPFEIRHSLPPPIDFVLIEAGSFWMGSPEDELGAESREWPRHQVTLTKSFLMQSTEVTNQQYMEMAQWAFNHDPPLITATYTAIRDAMGSTPWHLFRFDEEWCEIAFDENTGQFYLWDAGYGINPDHPVKGVTWYGAAAYCDWMSLQAGLEQAYNHYTWQCNGNDPYSAEGYRLPTEAEWEYACRAGGTTAFTNGPITYSYCNPLDPVLDEVGWYCGNSSEWTHPVSQKFPNAWGLYDMHGNCAELCNDWFKEDYYSDPGSDYDPVGPSNGTRRVKRGMYWSSSAKSCRSAYRDWRGPSAPYWDVGFRLARSAE